VNVDLQEMLSSRADSAEPPAFDPGAIVAHGDRLVRRRRSLVAGGVALLVAAVVGATAVLTGPAQEDPLPADDPVHVPEWPPGTPGTRPLAYGQGQVLHLGRQEVDTGLDFIALDVTDEGAALLTLDGGIWFTDGTTVDRIGTTLGVGRIMNDGWTWQVGRPPESVASGSAGSLLAWLEFPTPRVDQPELVVYDTDRRAVVARQPIEVTPGNSATVIDVVDNAVFVEEDDRGSSDPTPVLRYDLDTGALDRVTDRDVADARRAAGPHLVVGPAGEPLGSADDGFGTIGVRDARLEGLRDPRTGGVVEIAVPESYGDGNMWFTQWLDDDRFVLAPGAGLGELLVCGVSERRCSVVVDGLTRRGPGPALTPGDGLRGGEYALGRAVEAYRQQP
jgi:hypothetical protein